MSNNTEDDCYIPTPLSTSFNNAAASIFILVIVISLFGNVIVLIVIYKNHAMRTVTNLLICNSAVADLLITLLPTVWEVIFLLKYKTWPLGQFMCTFMYMSVYLSVAATVLTLVIITADRYNAVIHPYKKYITMKMLPVIIPTIWIISFLFASPTTFIQKVVYYEGYGLVCTEQWPSPFSSTESPKHYTIILFISLYTLPLIVLSILYAIIAKNLSRKFGVERKPSGLTFPSHTNLSCNTNNVVGETNPEKVTNRTSQAKHRPRISSSITKKRRVIKMLISIVIVFAICWFPVYCIQFIIYINPYYKRCPTSMPAYAYFIAFFMQYANSAINPLLYFGFSMSYRKGFINAFPCCFRKVYKRNIGLRRCKRITGNPPETKLEVKSRNIDG